MKLRMATSQTYTSNQTENNRAYGCYCPKDPVAIFVFYGTIYQYKRKMRPFALPRTATDFCHEQCTGAFYTVTIYKLTTYRTIEKSIVTRTPKVYSYISTRYNNNNNNTYCCGRLYSEG